VGFKFGGKSNTRRFNSFQFHLLGLDMSTRNAVYKLKNELAFWQRIHEHEPMDEREFELERQIRQLENRDQFGTPRYNGHIEDDNTQSDYEYEPRNISCRYCGANGLRWSTVDGKWRLKDSNGFHVCVEYQRRVNK